AGVQCVFLLHGEHDIGLADLPTVRGSGRGRRRRQILPISFLRTLISPGYNRVDLLLSEPAVISELTVMRISVPGRHRMVDDFFLYRFSPRTRVFESEQRHRSEFV